MQQFVTDIIFDIVLSYWGFATFTLLVLVIVTRMHFKKHKDRASAITYGLVAAAAISIIYINVVKPWVFGLSRQPQHIRPLISKWIDITGYPHNPVTAKDDEVFRYELDPKDTDIPLFVAAKSGGFNALLITTGIHLNDFDASLFKALPDPEKNLFKNKLELALASYGSGAEVHFGTKVPHFIEVSLNKELPYDSLTESGFLEGILYIRRAISIVTATTLIELEGRLYEQGKLPKPRRSP